MEIASEYANDFQSVQVGSSPTPTPPVPTPDIATTPALSTPEPAIYSEGPLPLNQMSALHDGVSPSQVMEGPPMLSSREPD